MQLIPKTCPSHAVFRQAVFCSARKRLVTQHARSRRTASEPAGSDSGENTDTPAAAAAAPAPAPAPAAAPLDGLVKSSRRSVASSRSRRTGSLQPVLSPVQKLLEQGVIATDSEGQSYVDVACLGQGQPHWYELGLLENKEGKYIGLLSKKLAELGYTLAPVFFTPAQPETAAAAVAEEEQKLQDAVAEAAAVYDAANAEVMASTNTPAEAGAQARRGEADAVLKEATAVLQSFQQSAVASAQAAAASARMLEQYDVVVWNPRKSMKVYSHHTDKLIDKEVSFTRGTGGATLLVHCRLDPTLAEAIASTWYFTDWRSFQPVSGALLNQQNLLPDSEDLNAVYKLPEPCTEDFLLKVANWTHTPEAEDLETERRLYYGTGAGSPFGARPEQGAARADRNNPSRWSVTAGPTNAGAAALIAAGQPLPWEEEQQRLQEEAFGQGRGRGRGGGARGGGRGGRGGRGFSQQQQQQQWQQRQPPQQQGRGYAVAAAAGPSAGDPDWPGLDEDFSEQNRQNQMDWMEDLGGSRYKSVPSQDFNGEDYGSSSSSGKSDGWQQQQQKPLRQQWQQQQSEQEQQGAGRDGGTTRMRQLDFTGDMGSDRYSDDEDRYNYDRLEGLDGTGQQGSGSGDRQQQQQQQQQQRGPAGGGRDRGRNMQQQLRFMADMGSDRYSSDDEMDVRPRAGQQQPSRGGPSSRGSSGDLSSLLSDFADAFSYSEGVDLPGSGSARNNAAGDQGLGGPAGDPGAWGLNPGRASYMDEDTFGWGGGDAGGDASMGGVSDEGSAAAQALLQEWQSEGGPSAAAAAAAPGFKAKKLPKPYQAGYSTRSQEGIGASFEFEQEAGPGLASADSILGQIPDLESLQQQQQQQQEPPAVAPAAAKRKGRASTSTRRSRKTEDAAPAAAGGAVDAAAAAAAPKAAAGSSRRKTSTRKTTGSTRQQRGSAAAPGGDEPPLEGWVGGADAGDEGFEEGWVDRMMGDGNGRAGIDDVLRS